VTREGEREGERGEAADGGRVKTGGEKIGGEMRGRTNVRVKEAEGPNNRSARRWARVARQCPSQNGMQTGVADW